MPGIPLPCGIVFFVLHLMTACPMIQGLLDSLQDRLLWLFWK